MDAATARQQLRELCYLQPEAAAELGRRFAVLGGAVATEGWLYAALSELFLGKSDSAATALAHARADFHALGDATGLAWCDELHAIALRRAGNNAECARLQADLDARPGTDRDPLYRFVAHNGRAIFQMAHGHADESLRHFYAAHEAAFESGLDGPRVIALSNLGGFHEGMYNLEDARQLCEQALAEARRCGMKQAVTASAAHLVFIYFELGDHRQAREMAGFMLDHPDENEPGAATRFRNSLALGLLGGGEVDRALQLLDAGPAAPVGNGDGLGEWAWIRASGLLAKGHASDARELLESTLAQRAESHFFDSPYSSVRLRQVLADACEQLGDPASALRWQRETHQHYVQLLGRSARARGIALEVSHKLAAAQRERDLAVLAHRQAEEDRRRLAELNVALQAKMAETERLHQALSDQALRDPLTGLHNRRYLFDAGAGLLKLAQRRRSLVCVVLLDLDHFKRLNDTHGHQAGDQVLVRFGTLLRRMLRESDIVCRYGGEEFVAVMPDTDAAQAQTSLTRLLDALAQLPPEPGMEHVPNVSFSDRLAIFPQHGVTLDQLLQRADKALYSAKHLGRARIEKALSTGFVELG